VINMDTLDDKEIKSIWRRVKKYINPENIKANTREELAREIERQMTFAGSTQKQGSMDVLVRKGFADRITLIEDVQGSYIEAATPEGRELQERRRRTRVKEIESPDKAKIRFTKKRVVVKSKGRFKSFKPENVSISAGSFRGKAAYYVTNKRTGKRLTWGIIK